jgi:hypothetical protein
VDGKGSQLDALINQVGPEPLTQPILQIVPYSLEYRGLYNAIYAAEEVNERRSSWFNEAPGGNAVDYGRKLVALKTLAGNCLEMACVAAFMACFEIPAETYIGIAVTGGPGDHVFCVVGDAAIDGWEKPDAPPACNAIVIDPWARVCCEPKDYMREFTKAMGAWNRSGKRIAGGGNEWLAPDDQYIAKIRHSKLEIWNARISFPPTG